MISNPAINKAIGYILEHIGDEISIEDVANHCHFSKYYFSRLFKQETGESVYQFIKRVKLEQGAVRLKATGIPITDVGAEYGYSASNYSSAFKQHHHMSPAKFRQDILERSLAYPVFPGVDITLDTFSECDAKISIEIFPDYFVIFERFIGDYQNLSANWGSFQERYKAYMEKHTLLIDRSFDDPSITARNKCLYDLCMTVSPSCPLENTYVLTGGKFAVYHFKGYPKEIYGAFQNIFCVWLKESGHALDERYCFEIYRKINYETSYMEIDICIPVR